MLERFPADGGYKYYTDADLVTGSAGGDNITSSDPVFVGASDVHLQVSSPAIDAGYPSGTVTGFSDPAPSWLDSANDIGIYEYGGDD
jgi:hypothetical protein